MTSLRTSLIGVTAASLLALPAGATALTSSGPGQGTTSAATSASTAATAERTSSTQAARHNTAIRFLRMDHTRPWGHRIRVRGQVAAWVRGQRGALQGVRVSLYRQLDGRSRWVRLRTQRTSHQAQPKFQFRVRAKANAEYRVTFKGNRRFQPARDKTHVSVHRTFGPRLEDGTGRFHGRVRPRYGNKVIHLDKRRCAGCGWDRVRTKRTDGAGHWRFKVGAPDSGRWWWRVSVPGSRSYIRSYSAVFTTEQR
jgi:hypothetical protein